ncbi:MULTISPECIES: NUDIX domain-containing protein [unclassified Parafrankia]|uniref:NUDIX domain-containing protein n=1 Tax=unclassified Parafrankia TaxID=2994368 RepID=UPI000DA5535C|nr:MULTISPECIES: NUDIX hydrolase [unclassified Parafrankia]TCJ31581.1 NUDIX hydrolase [Parafrankia sp. BMG5.11]SQD99954.1 conserved hypothetical protein [Parafrankia sp. Ea1.12]
MTVLAQDYGGNVLLAFQRVAEQQATGVAPLPLALVALWRGDDLLLVRDRRRECWELPGGTIEPGETPRQAAVRELREESGYEAEALVFAGLAHFGLAAPSRTEYAAVFTGRAGASHPFTPDAEIATITWWDGTRPLPGRVQVMDVALARLSRTAPPPR